MSKVILFVHIIAFFSVLSRQLNAVKPIHSFAVFHQIMNQLVLKTFSSIKDNVYTEVKKRQSLMFLCMSVQGKDHVYILDKVVRKSKL